MLDNERDIKRIEGIIDYCNKVERTLQRLSNDYDNFINDEDLQQSISFSLAQIGELANSLSAGFKNETQSDIPWHSIVSFRNMIVHEYNREIFDIDVVWQTAVNDLSDLKCFCEDRLDLNKGINRSHSL